MYDDLLGEKEELNEVTKDSIISAQKANIEAKEELIKELIEQITQLEKENEMLKQL
jgi:hypothetical protein